MTLEALASMAAKQGTSTVARWRWDAVNAAVFPHAPELASIWERAAMRGVDPAIFFEHRSLLMTSDGSAPYPGDDYVLPFGRARVVQRGDVRDDRQDKAETLLLVLGAALLMLALWRHELGSWQDWPVRGVLLAAGALVLTLWLTSLAAGPGVRSGGGGEGA